MSTIVFVKETPFPGHVAITFAEGPDCIVDMTLPPDIPARQQLSAWLDAGHSVTPYAAPPEALPEISDRQFAQGLAVAGIITEAEAEEWVGPGTVPAVLLGFVDELPQGERFAARMLLRGATQFERAHPLTEAFAAMHGWSPEQTDQFWRDCAAL